MPRIRHTLKISLAALMLMAASGVSLYAAPRQWETVKTERSDAKRVGGDGDVEVKSARGVVIISTNRPVQVRIYTILGQLVSNDNLSPGTFQFSVSSHGVYIIKVGDNITYKVAL